MYWLLYYAYAYVANKFYPISLLKKKYPRTNSSLELFYFLASYTIFIYIFFIDVALLYSQRANYRWEANAEQHRHRSHLLFGAGYATECQYHQWSR